MFKARAITSLDFYKTGHIRQYPEGTEIVSSNGTSRSSNYSNTGLDYTVWFGMQAFMKAYLEDCFNETFFGMDQDYILKRYKRRMDTSLGPNMVGTDHIAALHSLQKLPLHIKSLPEGSFVPYGVPYFTIKNTDHEFYWLTNYVESVMSTEIWRMFTSATTSHAYRKEFDRHAKKTGSPADFVNWQGHDFSFRGMGGIADAAMSSAAHLLSFTGTDTVPGIEFLEDYYNADCEKEMIGGSVPATEHSVMSMGSFGGEFETFKRLITETYPSGVLSIVADTWDFWRVLLEYLPRLKDEIMARDGRIVIRPDSSPKTPVEIICGDPTGVTRIEQIGAYEHLFNIFGGTVSDEGYKILDPHIGLLYGDSITLDRQKAILSQLEDKMFTASNLVLGIGSYTFAYCTRDTHGFAMKATWGQIDGVGTPIFKDPVTDPGFKRSAVGLLRVVRGPDNKVFRLHDMVTPEEELTGALDTVFFDGKIVKETSLAEIRARMGTVA